MDLDYWIQNADSFILQIFMIIMGVLQGMAHLFRVS
jgi:hypothetical protein